MAACANHAAASPTTNTRAAITADTQKSDTALTVPADVVHVERDAGVEGARDEDDQRDDCEQDESVPHGDLR